jgi:hypothetical protein
MRKIYISKGYNSWTNQELIKAFTTEKEADSFINGLTEPHIQVISYKNTADSINHLLEVKP